MTMLQGYKYQWQLPDERHQKVAHAFALSYSLSLPIAQVVASRGCSTAQELEQFLFSPRDTHVFAGHLLKDAKKAVDRLEAAIRGHEKILIAGDYDVDGMTATAMMLLCLHHVGAEVNFFLPHRVHDGYGLSVRTVQRAAENGYRVIVTVDNGITAVDAAHEALQRGIDLIITDHHQPHGVTPEAYAVVNPCQKECPFPSKQLAGVGVAFKVLELLFERLGVPLPDEVYELLLLGTIADVVPLKGENRYWVRYALQKVSEKESYALEVLKKNARLSKRISSLDIGFGLAPQLNALGRLDDPRDAVKFLIGEDMPEIERIGAQLYALNQARKQVERVVVSDVEADIKAGLIDPFNDPVIVAARAGWPPGVIGLAASRLVSAYGKPTFLFHEASNGHFKGSCRSIYGVNIFNLLSELQEYLVHFGGHAMAAGLAVERHLFGAFAEQLKALVRERYKPEDFVQKLRCDAELSLPEANYKLMHDMRYLEPFGAENEQPVFWIKNVSLLEGPTLLKEEHVRCSIFADGIIKPVIFFSRPDLHARLASVGDQPLHIAVRVVENEWEGQRRVEFHGVDVALGGL